MAFTPSPWLGVRSTNSGAAATFCEGGSPWCPLKGGRGVSQDTHVFTVNAKWFPQVPPAARKSRTRTFYENRRWTVETRCPTSTPGGVHFPKAAGSH